MKGNQYIIIAMIFSSFMILGGSLWALRNDIKALNRETQVHWMLPPKAECAIKVMYLKFPDGTKPIDRMVCHWSME